MKEEFKLSDKIEGSFKSVGRSVPIGDIKEFIKLLKEEVKSGLIEDKRYNGIRLRINYLIDKLAGENLK